MQTNWRKVMKGQIEIQNPISLTSITLIFKTYSDKRNIAASKIL